MIKFLTDAALGAAAVAGIVISVASPAAASPIIYTDQFEGSGSLGGSTFTDADIVLELDGDTSNAHSTGFGLYANFGPITATISGIGTVRFINDTFGVSANTNTGFSGFADYSVNRLIAGLGNASLSSFELVSFVGPVTGPGSFNPGFSFPTSAGGFVLTQVGTITLTVDAQVPEPPSAIILGAAVALLVVAQRRHKIA